MLTRSVALITLVLIPTFADAQRRVRGERRADWDAVESNSQSLPKINKGDLEGFSAIKLIVDKKKDLKLTDDQLSKLKDLDKKEEAQLEGLFKQLDSLRNATRVRPGEDPDQEKARTSLARQDLMDIVRNIRANYDSTFQWALPLLDDGQKKTATELVEKERAEVEEDVRGKLGGGGRSSGGAQPTTRRRP
jgi:hypothetical protein